MEFQKTLNFVVEENTYVINFPSNRQYIAIQDMMSSYARNYAEFQFMGPEPGFAGVLVETAAHLTILCPKLIENLNKPLLDLDLLQGKLLVDCYNEQFRPWYNEALNFVFGVNKEKKKDSESETTTTQDS